jgi:hypothetical protein
MWCVPISGIRAIANRDRDRARVTNSRSNHPHEAWVFLTNVFGMGFPY